MYNNYQLLYENYYAEQEMLNSLSFLCVKMSGPITESCSEALQESVKDTIMNYVKKIVANVQDAWNKFKTSIDDAIIKEILDKNEKYLNTGFIAKIPVEFKIPNLVEFDKFNKKRIVDFGNYEAMKDDLESADTFMKKYYSDYLSDDEKKSVKDVLFDKIFKVSDGNDTVGKEDIDKYVEFLKSFKNTSNDISSDLNIINGSVHSVETLVNQIISTQEAFSLGKTILTYFNEVEDGDEEKQSKEFTAVSTTPNNKTVDNDKEKKDTMSKDIIVYFKCTTMVLSAKLSACDKIKNSSIEMIRKYAKAQAGSEPDTEVKADKEENNKATRIKV